MNELIALHLPNLGAALIVALLACWGSSLLTTPRRYRQIVFWASLVLCLIPVDGMSISHYARVLTGDLSFTGFIWFSIASFDRLYRSHGKTRGDEQFHVALVIVVTALVLYPTALGLTKFDLYAFGYQPIILAPFVLALFFFCVWHRFLLPACILAIGFAGYSLGLLESDNLWDYLMDPIVTIYAAIKLFRRRFDYPDLTPNRHQIETGLIFLAASYLLFAVFLARFNHDLFQFRFVVEDGFIEWCTVLVLIITMIVCARRVYYLRQVRGAVFLGVTGLLTLLCLFGAGEEISWGQRLLGLETPEYFEARNAQQEIGFHNLVVEIGGEEVKLNRLIFGTGLAIAMVIYLFVATPLYRTQLPVRRFFNHIAAPMPRNYQIAGYLIIVAVVELLVDSSKRGEMTEFAGSIMFALNVIYPDNPEIFDPDKELV